MTRWVTLGKNNDKFAKKTRELLRRCEPFSTREIDGEICFGLKISAFKNKPILHRTKWAFHSSGEASISYSPFLPPMSKETIDDSHIPKNIIQELPSFLDSLEGIKRFERLQRVIYYSSLSQLNDVLNQIVLPTFFRWYPTGEWFFSTANRDFNIALAALRVIGGARDLTDRDYDQLLAMGSFKMIIAAQSGGVFYGNKYLSIPFTMLLPAMYGFIASKVVFSFAFLFDEPIKEIRSPFPRSGLEFFRSDASNLFGQMENFDVKDLPPEAIDTFRLLPQSFSKLEVKEFIDQYISKLNQFLIYMVDPANFVTSSHNQWAGLAHYRTWLDFERLTDEVIYLLTDDSPFLRKLALFRILDQVSSLKTSKRAEQAEVFRQLILPNGKNDLLTKGLENYTGAVANSIKKLLKSLRSELRNTVLDSIYIPGVYDKESDLIKFSDGKTLNSTDYITGVIRELRNTHHGYHTDQFDRYLQISSGNTPDSLPGLGLLLYLALISKPEIFLTRDWS